MKRYLLFIGYNYYPCGGWSDFKETFNTLLECEEYLCILKANERCKDWFQIVDTQTGLIVKEG